MGNTTSDLGDEVITNETFIAQGGYEHQYESRYGGFKHLRPSEIRFNQDSIGCKFTDGHTLEETFSDILYGRVRFQRGQLPPIVVMKYNGSFYALRGNRRLYLLKKLESIGEVHSVKVKELPFDEMKLRSQFTTRNGGLSVRVRGDPHIDENLNEIIREFLIRSRGQEAQLHRVGGGQEDTWCIIL